MTVAFLGGDGLADLTLRKRSRFRATRVTELIKVYGKTQHSVCNWIGHTKQIEDEHYLMMMKEDHNHAVGIVTDPKVGDKIGDSTPITQQSTVLSDDVLQRVMDTTEAEALAENTLLLQELTTLLHSNPVATDLLLSSISKTTKNLKSSSNRGRIDGFIDGKYRVGKMKGVNTTPITTPSEPSNATIGFNKRKLQGLLGSIWDAVQETIEIEKQS